jgi:transcriptional regulator with PAS, ATPase and Fis domain
MKNCFDLIKQFADTDVTVLITGATGTGKELVANAIHYSSDRKDKPFIKVNCAAISENLLETELFGHKKGSFTGSLQDKKGKIEAANNGTLFLDEIGDISPNLQAKLLRVLQEKDIEIIGEIHPKKINVRFIAATNQNLEKKVAENKFRKDLYYRLINFKIEVPALKERGNDIYLLIDFFSEKFSKKYNKPKIKIPDETMKVMLNYDWPGNVRELEHTIERAYIICNNNPFCVDCLPKNIIENKTGFNILENKNKINSERDYLVETLNSTNWNKSEAAEKLNMSRTGLWKKLKKYNIR